MAKKKSTWLSPKKQAELDLKNKKARQKKIGLIVFLSVLATLLIGGLVAMIVILTQPLDPYYAYIEIEDYGTIVVELDPNEAPETVENFVKLANEGFYDGLTFHRIMEGFMMQGGCPNGDGTGDSDETVVGEFSANGYDNNISHSRGVISMARGDGYDSGSCQFFIVHKDSTHLDGKYAGFGYVLSGMEIVDAICESAKPINDNGKIPKDQQPVIKTITISRSYLE